MAAATTETKGNARPRPEHPHGALDYWRDLALDSLLELQAAREALLDVDAYAAHRWRCRQEWIDRYQREQKLAAEGAAR